MNSELYRLLMEYDGLDDDFINRAFEIIMKEEKGLEPFVLDFDIKVEDNPRLGSYNNETRQILVNPENIKEFPDVSNKKLLALNVLRHEIEHARNLQRLYEFRSDIESTVVKYSLMEYAIDHRMAPITSFDQIDAFGMAYRKIENYQIDPGERLADIKAWRYLVNLLKNQRRTDDLLEARKQLYYAYIRGYVSNGWYLNAPTYEYLLKMGLYHEYYLFKKRVEEKQYVLDTRLMCGLPLVYGDEYDKEILRKVKLQKRKQTK